MQVRGVFDFAHAGEVETVAQATVQRRKNVLKHILILRGDKRYGSTA